MPEEYLEAQLSSTERGHLALSIWSIYCTSVSLTLECNQAAQEPFSQHGLESNYSFNSYVIHLNDKV